MPVPVWVSSFYDYIAWVEKLLAECGGYLEASYVEFELLGLDPEAPLGLLLDQQRLTFFDESFLEFSIVLDRDLELVEYNFFRKDKHPGHEDEVGLTHIHDDPGDPDRRRSFEEVDLAEVLGEIYGHLQVGVELPGDL